MKSWHPGRVSRSIASALSASATCRASPRGRGLTLLEVVVALALTALLVLGTVSVLLEQRRIDHRARAQREALRSIEAQHEALRSGLPFPLVVGSHAMTPILEPDEVLEDFRMVLQVEPLGSGLYGASLLSQYSIRDKAYEQRLELRLWRAP